MTKIRVKENVKSTNRKATSHVQGTPTKQPVDFLAETLSGGQSGVAWCIQCDNRGKSTLKNTPTAKAIIEIWKNDKDF